MSWKKLIDLYLCRNQIEPIQLGSQQEFIEFLESHAARVDNRSALKSIFYGQFQPGYFYNIEASSVVIRYKKRVRRWGRYFIGEFRSNGDNIQLEGHFRGSIWEEVLSYIALLVGLFGMVGLAVLFYQREPIWPSSALFLFAIPFVLYSVRLLESGAPMLGANAFSEISRLLELYVKLKSEK